MSVYETLPQTDQGVHIHRGVIARDVPDLVTMAYVLLPNFDPTLQFGPAMWQPRGAVPPKRGDVCLVLLDNAQQPWITAWWPKASDPIYPIEGRSIGFHVGASPPSSPSNNDLWCLPADASGVNWLFKYNAGSASSMKWEIVGGACLHHEIAAVQQTATGPTAYVDLATVGPTLTVPRTGDYDINFGCMTYYTGGGPGAAVTFMSPKLGATATSDNDAIQHDNQSSSIGYGGDSYSIRRSLTAADVVKCQYKINGIAIGNFGNRWMNITPIRVQ